MSGDAGFDIFRHHSGKGTDKGEKKAGNLVLSHVLWLTWLPVQVSSLRLAAASEAALVGILKPVGRQLQPAAASLLVIVFGVVYVAAAAMFGIFTLGRDFCFPAFVFSLIEENVATLMNHGVDDSHDLVYSSSDVGSCFVGMFWDFGSRSSQLHVLERLWVCSHSWVCSPALMKG